MSNKDFLILYRNSCSKISIGVLSLFVVHGEPATMGLNLGSLGFIFLMYSDFCVSTAFLKFSLDLWIFDCP